MVRKVAITGAIASIIAVLLAPSAVSGWLASHPSATIEADNALEAFGPGWRVDSTATPDAGWIADSLVGKPTIVMVHGFRQPRSDLRRLANNLHELGYAITLVELPYLDGSEPYSGGKREVAAIRDAVTSARKVSNAPVVLMGFSAGGFASALAVREGLAVNILITDSAFVSAASTFREIGRQRTRLPTFMFAGISPAFALFSSGGSLKDLRSVTPESLPPTFVIHCETDDYVVADNARELSDFMGGELWISPGDGHGCAWYGDPAGYESRVDAFISQAISRP